MRLGYTLLCGGMLGALAACGSKAPDTSLIPPGPDPGSAGTGGVGGGGGAIPGTGEVGQAGTFMLDNSETDCQRQTCAELGWACGYLLDHCGQVVNCADEGLSCGAGQICEGGLGSPTQCVAGANADCSVCSAIADCSGAAQPTRLTGRVITPGRTDNDTGNQVGVPNAIVYILRGTDASVLPAIPSGIPSDGTSCDRCEDQDLGPVLVGGVTDASGNFTLEGNVPVNQEFVLVVKAGKFRRASKLRLEATAACTTVDLPVTGPTGNPTRLPRGNSDDGLAIHLPHVAVSTGQIDAMECVLEKMGISHPEFGNPGANGTEAPSIHLYRGGSSAPGSGARIDTNTPYDSALYSDLARLEAYDMVVSDCEGGGWDADSSQRSASGPKLLEYVNRGGRLFASHLSFSWLNQNGSAAYDAAAPLATGLGPAATWDTANIDTATASGTGSVALGRPRASSRIDAFAAWMDKEGIAPAPARTFNILQPRSQATGLGTASEEFVFIASGRTQQFSFNTPYGAPDSAVCGRVAYSGFHVSAGSGGASPYASVLFPSHCSGDLTAQEKVLLYMLFDLGACVGAPPVPPPCAPVECGITSCGFTPDGCGNVLDCGPCRPPA